MSEGWKGWKGWKGGRGLMVFEVHFMAFYVVDGRMGRAD